MAYSNTSFQPSAIIAHTAINTRLGADDLAANRYTQVERQKFVKLAADSRHVLAALGDPIEAQIYSVDAAPSDLGGSFGSFVRLEWLYVLADGLQATPGVGNLAVGDYVVCGTPVPQGTALGKDGYAKVCKATLQPGGPLANFAEVSLLQKQMLFAHRVISLDRAATGAPGTRIVIERLSTATQQAV